MITVRFRVIRFHSFFGKTVHKNIISLGDPSKIRMVFSLKRACWTSTKQSGRCILQARDMVCSDARYSFFSMAVGFVSGIIYHNILSHFYSWYNTAMETIGSACGMMSSLLMIPYLSVRSGFFVPILTVKHSFVSIRASSWRQQYDN